MARSSDPPQKLIELVDRYEDQGPISADLDLSDLFDNPEYASGACQVVARDFYSWLTHEGEYAFIVRQQPCFFFHLEVSGLREEIHDAVVIQMDGEQWIVDWTAAQYGMTDAWPIIARFQPPR